MQHKHAFPSPPHYTPCKIFMSNALGPGNLYPKCYLLYSLEENMEFLLLGVSFISKYKHNSMAAI